jgi:cell division protein FtsB
MISARKSLTAPRVAVVKEIVRLRQELEDLSDYLDLLEARARNEGLRRYSTAEVKKTLGLD